MRIEVLSVSKYLSPLRPGEDVPVVVPGRCFAVFDGATDVNGSKIAGMQSGRFAALTAAAALLAAGPAEARTARELVDEIDARLAGELARWSETLGRQVGAATTMALMEPIGDRLRFTLVGDSGIRINGRETFQYLKPVDDVMSAGRVLLQRLLAARGLVGRELEAKSRQGVFHGFDAAIPELISAAEATRLITAAGEALAAAGFGPAILAEVDAMLRAGIAKGQYARANDPDHPLGYASLDGSGRCAGFGLTSFERPAAEVRSVEIFSDGYLDRPEEVSVAAWEAVAARIEAEDPKKVITHWGVKGSSEEQLFDDRTVIVLTDL
jgi:hypothetical protein